MSNRQHPECIISLVGFFNLSCCQTDRQKHCAEFCPATPPLQGGSSVSSTTPNHPSPGDSPPGLISARPSFSSLHLAEGWMRPDGSGGCPPPTWHSSVTSLLPQSPSGTEPEHSGHQCLGLPLASHPAPLSVPETSSPPQAPTLLQHPHTSRALSLTRGL